MHEPLPIYTLGLIVLTSICSWKGFGDPAFREKHLFSVREILVEKQFHRLFTSAFLHADWGHLALNMITLYLFGREIELFFGPAKFLAVYFAAVIGGSGLSLWIHRHHEYTAYGASGGACGIVFSYVLLFPGSSIYLFPVPFGIPGWLYAVLFLFGSFFALKRQADNIGHDAHLGGAIIGLWTAAAFQPSSVRLHPWLFITLSLLAVLLFVCLIKNPLFLPVSGFFPQKFKRKNVSATKKRKPRNEQMDVDVILEKIARQGIDSLTPEEKAVLNSTSAKYRRRTDSKKPGSELIL